MVGNVPGERLMYRLPEAAAILGLGRTTLYELVAAGSIRPVRLGRAIRITRSELERFVAERCTPTNAAAS
jgi:excisionase family DNA binding protein